MTIRFQGLYHFTGDRQQVTARVAQMSQDPNYMAMGVIGMVRPHDRRTAEGVVLTQADFIRHLRDDYGLKPQKGQDTNNPDFLATLNTPHTINYMVQHNSLSQFVGIARRMEDGDDRDPVGMIEDKLFDYYKKRSTEGKGLDATGNPIAETSFPLPKSPEPRRHWYNPVSWFLRP